MKKADTTYLINGKEHECTVTEDGRVFLKEKEVEVFRNGKSFIRYYPEREVSYTLTKYGYVRCVAGYVHRLVAQCFIPNPHNLRTVNHKDFNKNNNHASNLEWMSLKDNVNHYYSSEHAIDERNYAVELFENGESIGVFKSQLDAAKEVGVYKSSMHYLLNGKFKTLRGRYTGKRISKTEYYAKKKAL